MRKSFVFISSTVYDLLDERKAIYHMLEDKGYIPLASEYPSFDLANGKRHSYRICLDNVEKSDIVIAILGHRCGGMYTDADSITFKEIKHARNKNKVVYTFCKQSVADERLVFKKALKNFPSKEEAFRSVKSGFKTDSYMVFENIDRITRFDKNNWISFYSDKDDLLNKVQAKLAGYHLDKLKIERVNYAGVIDMLTRGTDLRLDLYDNAYDENRDRSDQLLRVLNSFVDYDESSYRTLADASIFDKLKRYYSENTDYANAKGMESAELCIHEKNKVFYGFDTQMELNSINIWMKDRSFKNYLLFTANCARKEKNKHYRVFLFDHEGFILDNRLSIYNTINTHLDYGITPILTTYSNIPYDIPFDLINCNALLGERVLVVMLPVGVTMLFTKHNGRDRLKLYDDSFEHILSLARQRRGALKISSHMPYREFVALIRDFEF